MPTRPGAAVEIKTKSIEKNIISSDVDLARVFPILPLPQEGTYTCRPDPGQPWK